MVTIFTWSCSCGHTQAHKIWKAEDLPVMFRMTLPISSSFFSEESLIVSECDFSYGRPFMISQTDLTQLDVR